MKKAADRLIIAFCFISISALAHAESAPFHEGPARKEAGGEMFKSMDTNRDGAISKAEFNAFSARHFKKMDANKDGKLTPDEIPGSRKQGMGHGDSKLHLDERFNAADTNRDGGLDREEAKEMPMLLKYFDEMDESKDGKITRQEYLDAMPRLHRGKRMDPGKNMQTM